MMRKYFYYSINLILFSNFVSQIVENSELHLSKKKRALLFPSSSTIGIFAAVAVPLDLPNRNVFMSYNFEANYNLPYEGNHYIPGPLQKFIPAEDLGPYDARDNNADTFYINKSKNQTNSRKIRHTLGLVLSRKNIYQMLELKLQKSGFSGKACLLKIICESNSWQIGLSNGVLGSIFHIIFAPSSSKDENFQNEYYTAEKNGFNIKCNEYNSKCPKNILDLISISERF